jgi:hypothetical protein
MPDTDAFREVRCRDLSSHGFSFETLSIPNYKHLLIAFGKGDDLIYLVAEIVHVTPTGELGDEQYVVGCRYTGRASQLLC